MKSFKLEKRVRLYKNQFEKMCTEIFQSYILDRMSIELDNILFRIKYMIKHKKDLDKIPQLEKKFNEKSTELRNLFGRFLYVFLTEIIGNKELFKKDLIRDVLAQDVKMDSVYVSFTMILISDYKQYLEYVDNSILDDEVYNIFPEEFFRIFTDSYNDGIMKAFPELFENKTQNTIGVGNDKDVFVHSFTFQTTERCSLQCTYCFAKGTKVVMADLSEKNIEDIKEGDMVLGIPEDTKRTNEDYHCYHNEENYIPTKVTKTFHHQEETIEVWYQFGGECNELFRVTRNHPFLTVGGEFKTIEKIMEDDDSFIWKYPDEMIFTQMNSYELAIRPHRSVEDVYNLETETHTYIANCAVVHNCYQFNKSPMRMHFATAKKFINDLLDDRYGYINRYNSPAIIIEFIGGEPLLEINLTRQIYEYFLEQCYERNHPWFEMHRLSICSNGLQYFDEDVQLFFKDYAQNISFNISIDGNKELHDACRIQPNGEGSYDIDIAALNHYNKHFTPERNSKMTLAPSNMKYLFDSVVNFIENGMSCINLNCIFEEGWNQDTALEEYNQLKKLADYILDNNLEHLYIAIFNERQEDIQDKYQDSNFCGGTGSMLAMRPNGNFYPCLRYMPSSVGDNVQDLCIGNVDTGIIGREQGSEILDMMDRITRRSQMNDICFECPIGNDCASCSALGHTVYGTPNKRCMFICIQMIAEALANVYYWNLLNIKHPEYQLGVRKNNVPDEWSLLVIDKDELNYLKKIEAYSMIITMENL